MVPTVFPVFTLISMKCDLKLEKYLSGIRKKNWGKFLRFFLEQKKSHVCISVAGQPLYFQKLGFPAVGYVHTTWKTWMIRKIANKMRKIHHFIKNLVMPFLRYLVSTGAHCTTFTFFVFKCFPKMDTNDVDVKKIIWEKILRFFQNWKNFIFVSVLQGDPCTSRNSVFLL